MKTILALSLLLSALAGCTAGHGSTRAAARIEYTPSTQPTACVEIYTEFFR